jgi:hypothetical protein
MQSPACSRIVHSGELDLNSPLVLRILSVGKVRDKLRQ